MLKKLNISILFFLVLAIGFFSFYYLKNTKKDIKIAPVSETAKQEEKNTVSASITQPIFISGWLPYWKKEDGAASLAGKINIFDEINPFAFSVALNGSLFDTAKIDNSPWLKLEEDAKKENVRIVPTILWADAAAMHHIFTDSNLLNNHIDAIVTLLEQKNFKGVDIDYEGKNIADRDNFTNFLKVLHEKLSPIRKTVSCTVEARTQDSPPTDWGGTRAMSWANDFSALNNFCDSVRIMAYDEMFQTHGQKQVFEDTNETSYAPNADEEWVQEVMKYALRFMVPEKLMIGVPTYGWEFKLTKLTQGYRYTRVKSVSYTEAIEKAKEAGIEPKRDEGGELSFVYKTTDGQHIVTFSDAESIQQKIVLAQNLHIKGISLFKLDGLSDPQLFSMLEKY